MSYFKYFKLIFQYYFCLLLFQIPGVVTRNDLYNISSDAVRFLRIDPCGIMFVCMIDGKIEDIVLPINDILYIEGRWIL